MLAMQMGGIIDYKDRVGGTRLSGKEKTEK